MENKTIQILQEGRKFIDPIMKANGFHWEDGLAGKSSGGYSACGQYIKGGRRLELHFRYSLGLVTYHLADASLSHEDYMRYIATGKAEYPGFSENPMDGFKHLAHDLKSFASDFLSGSGQEFIGAKKTAEERNTLSGFKKILGTEF